MSHKRKCGCVIADGRDRDVRLGYSLSGGIISPCYTHKPLDQDKVMFRVTLDEIDERIARAIALHEEREHNR